MSDAATLSDALAAPEPPRRTALYETHVSLGARMTAFAGYEMPLQYGRGIMAEHLHTRAAAGLFDASHMGQIELRPRAGDLRGLALALEGLVPVDVADLPVGRQRYGLLTTPDGGIIDDLMIANLGDRLLLVVNAAGKAADLAHIEAGVGEAAFVSSLGERTLLALQGPGAADALAALAPEAAGMRFMDARAMDVAGIACVVTRSGYTGEDGFEIGAPAEAAQALFDALTRQPGVEPAGLGARDSLRLEAGLCLYGADISTGTTPVEAALEWAISKARRRGGPREGGFPGAGPILEQLAHGAPRRRVGLRPAGKAPIRAGAPLFASEQADAPIGQVTSGGFGPSAGAPVAMAYVDADHLREGVELFAELRGARVPVVVAPLPFVPHAYRR